MNKKWWKHIIRPSSMDFFIEGRRTPGYSLSDWLHGYVYARWPYLYIGIGTGEHRLARSFGPLLFGIANMVGRMVESAARLLPQGEHSQGEKRATFVDTYHGKVVPLKAATELVLVNEDVRLGDLEKIIPYNLARDLILKNPDHIIALECPCRASRENPCLPMDVCLIIGEPFASFVLEHHPHRARAIARDEAVEILQAEDERGHVHHAFFKSAMLERFYAICNCCSCCCGAMQIHFEGTPMLASSGYVAEVDEDLCIACGECAEICQFEALSLNEYHSVVDEGVCMGCGVCANHCLQRAISLRRELSKGVPLEICELISMSFPPV